MNNIRRSVLLQLARSTRTPIALGAMNRCLILLLCLLFLPPASIIAGDADYIQLGPEQISTFIPSETRTVINLSGTWQRIIDDASEPVEVPSTVEQVASVTLRRTVNVPASMVSRHAWNIQFLGIVDEFELRINGRYIMRYPGGMTPFTIPIPDRAIQAGNNTIELTLAPTSELTSLVERFSRSGRTRRMGILREAFLIGTPHVWTSDVHVRTSVANGYGTVRVKATVSGGMVERLTGGLQTGNALTQGKVTVAVEALLRSKRDGIVVARSGAVVTTIERSRQQSIALQVGIGQPQRWSVDHPDLYDLVIQITREGQQIDTYATPVGFRTVSVASSAAGRVIMINDTTTAIHAIDYVEHFPERGTSMSWKQMERDVSLLKTLGVNVVRLRGASPHPYFLHLCDKYGLMVMAELPAIDVPSSIMHQSEILARLRNAGERLATYLDSHPSVIALGVSDGLEEGSDAVSAYHADMVQFFRKTTSKLLYKVVQAGLYEKTSEGGFDIIVMSFRSTRDRDRFNLLVGPIAQQFRAAAVLTEFGSQLSPANTNGYDDPLSNEAQARVVRDCFRSTFAAGLAGVLVWGFADYSLDRPTMLVDHFDAYLSTSGLVDEWRQPRVSYSMLKSLINDEKEPLIQADEEIFSTPIVFIVGGIVLALIMTFLINRSRRFREYLIRAIARPYNFYADIRDQRILSMPQTTFLGIVIASCAGLVVASVLFYARVDSNLEYILHLIVPSDVAYEVVRFVSWRPTLAVPLWSAIVLSLFALAAAFLRIGAMFVKARIYYRDTLTIVVWSSLPLVVLLPIGVALYQALSTDALSLWVPILIFSLIVWSLLRTLRATSVVFDVPSSIVYSIGLGLVIAFAVILLITWNASYEAFDYLKYYLAVVRA